MKPSDRRSRPWRSLIQQASRLNLGTSHLNSGVGTKSRKPEDQMSSVGAQSGFLSEVIQAVLSKAQMTLPASDTHMSIRI